MKLLLELPVFRSNVVGVKTKGFFCVLVLSFKAKIKEKGFDFFPLGNPVSSRSFRFYRGFSNSLKCFAILASFPVSIITLLY